MTKSRRHVGLRERVAALAVKRRAPFCRLHLSCVRRLKQWASTLYVALPGVGVARRINARGRFALQPRTGLARCACGMCVCQPPGVVVLMCVGGLPVPGCRACGWVQILSSCVVACLPVVHQCGQGSSAQLLPATMTMTDAAIHDVYRVLNEYAVPLQVPAAPRCELAQQQCSPHVHRLLQRMFKRYAAAEPVEGERAKSWQEVVESANTLTQAEFLRCLADLRLMPVRSLLRACDVPAAHHTLTPCALYVCPIGLHFASPSS